MASKKQEKLEIPENVRPWSASWTFLIVSVLATGVTVYLAVEANIEKYIDQNFKIQQQTLDLDHEKFRIQVEAKKEIQDLKLQELEKRVGELEQDLSTCERKLAECKK